MYKKFGSLSVDFSTSYVAYFEDIFYLSENLMEIS